MDDDDEFVILTSSNAVECQVPELEEPTIDIEQGFENKEGPDMMVAEEEEEDPRYYTLTFYGNGFPDFMNYVLTSEDINIYFKSCVALDDNRRYKVSFLREIGYFNFIHKLSDRFDWELDQNDDIELFLLPDAFDEFCIATNDKLNNLGIRISTFFKKHFS